MLNPFDLVNHPNFMEDIPSEPTLLEEQKDEEKASVQDQRSVSSAFEPKIKTAKKLKPPYFPVKGDPDLLAEMDREMERLCLAEDYSSDEETIKHETINASKAILFEVDRYLKGTNHYKIINLHAKLDPVVFNPANRDTF